MVFLSSLGLARSQFRDACRASERIRPRNTDILLAVEDAAAHLKISRHALNRWRVTDEGPPFIKFGPRLVHYLVTTLDVRAQERMFANTSQYGR